MPDLVAIEITDRACRSQVAATAQRLPDVEFSHPTVALRGATPEVRSVHSRLDPRRSGSESEILAALESVFWNAKSQRHGDDSYVCIIVVPGAYTVTQRELLRKMGRRAGFAGVGLVEASFAAAIGSTFGETSMQTVLAISADFSGMSASIVETAAKTSRTRTIEISATCGAGAFAIGALRVLSESVSSLGLDVRIHFEDCLCLLENAFPDENCEIVVGGHRLKVSSKRILDGLGSALEDFDRTTCLALADYAPSRLYLSRVMSQWPLVTKKLTRLVPTASILDAEDTILKGAIRYAGLVPPEVDPEPVPPFESFQVAAGGLEHNLYQEIEVWRATHEELEGQARQIQSQIAENYDRLAGMYRTQGEVVKAWEASVRSVKTDPTNREAAIRLRNHSKEIITALAKVRRFQEIDQVVRDIGTIAKRSTRLEQVLDPRYLADLRDYFRAAHLNKSGNHRESIKLLENICRRNRTFTEAAELLNKVRKSG